MPFHHNRLDMTILKLQSHEVSPRVINTYAYPMPRPRSIKHVNIAIVQVCLEVFSTFFFHLVFYTNSNCPFSTNKISVQQSCVKAISPLNIVQWSTWISIRPHSKTAITYRNSVLIHTGNISIAPSPDEHKALFVRLLFSRLNANHWFKN
jgi:hypothetical protein